MKSNEWGIRSLIQYSMSIYCYKFSNVHFCNVSKDSKRFTFNLKDLFLLIYSKKKMYTRMSIKTLFRCKIRIYININDILVNLFNSREFKKFSGSSFVYTGYMKLSCQLIEKSLLWNQPKHVQKLRKEILTCHSGPSSFKLNLLQSSQQL